MAKHLIIGAGEIGGHCVMPNCELLGDSYVAKLVLEKNKEFEQNNE